MAAFAGNTERYNDMRVTMESERRKAGKAATDLSVAEAHLKIAYEKSKMTEAQLIGANADIGRRNLELARLNLELNAFKEKEESWKVREAGLEEEISVLKARAGGGSGDYRGCVKRFLKTQTFTDLVNQKAAPAYEMGFTDLGGFIGAGAVFDPVKHNYQEYVRVEMAEGDAPPEAEGNAEAENEAGPSAPPEDEIPLEELVDEYEA